MLLRYIPLIVAVESLIILLLGYFLYACYTQWDIETDVRVDTVTTVERDTVWGGFEMDFEVDNPEPESILVKGRRDTVVQKDTVKIFVNPDTRLYTRNFSRDFTFGTVRSTVKGELLSQNVTIDVSFPKITEVRTRNIDRIVTKTQVGKWRVVASGDIFFGDGIEMVAPGIGLQRPTKVSIFYKYDFVNGWHGGSVNIPLSLLF